MCCHRARDLVAREIFTSALSCHSHSVWLLPLAAAEPVAHSIFRGRCNLSLLSPAAAAKMCSRDTSKYANNQLVQGAPGRPTLTVAFGQYFS